MAFRKGIYLWDLVEKFRLLSADVPSQKVAVFLPVRKTIHTFRGTNFIWRRPMSRAGSDRKGGLLVLLQGPPGVFGPREGNTLESLAF